MSWWTKWVSKMKGVKFINPNKLNAEEKENFENHVGDFLRDGKK